MVTGTATSNGNVTDFTGNGSTSGNTVDTGLNLTFGTLAKGDTTKFTVSGFDGTSATTQSNTSNYSSSETVYDSLGTAHTVTVNFRKDSVDATSQTSTWDWNVTVSGGDSVVSGGSGTMTFNENGVLTSGGTPQAVTFDFAGAQQNQTINLVFGSASGEGSSTQYSSASTTTYVGQDGYAPGVLQSVSVSNNGIISGTYDNGQILQLYQLTLASFNNPQGLKKEGGNLYSATLDSGTAYTNAPGQGGTGTISSNSLEESNVDLATEFVNMIIYQNGYEANSKVITTTDQILQSLYEHHTEIAKQVSGCVAVLREMKAARSGWHDPPLLLMGPRASLVTFVLFLLYPVPWPWRMVLTMVLDFAYDCKYVPHVPHVPHVKNVT